MLQTPFIFAVLVASGRRWFDLLGDPRESNFSAPRLEKHSTARHKNHTLYLDENYITKERQLDPTVTSHAAPPYHPPTM